MRVTWGGAGVGGLWSTPGMWWQRVTVLPELDLLRWGSRLGNMFSSPMWSHCQEGHMERRWSRFILTSNSLHKLIGTTWQWSGKFSWLSRPGPLLSWHYICSDLTGGWTMLLTSPRYVCLLRTRTWWVTMAGLLAGEPWSLAAGSDLKLYK